MTSNVSYVNWRAETLGTGTAPGLSLLDNTDAGLVLLHGSYGLHCSYGSHGNHLPPHHLTAGFMFRFPSGVFVVCQALCCMNYDLDFSSHKRHSNKMTFDAGTRSELYELWRYDDDYRNDERHIKNVMTTKKNTQQQPTWTSKHTHKETHTRPHTHKLTTQTHSNMQKNLKA